VEARTLDEVADVLKCGAQVDRILLDNMVQVDDQKKVDTTVLQQALQMIKDAPAVPNHRLLTEASGNVNLHTIGTIGATGVDYISVGALTHSVTALDISMKIKLQK
jgi:nicotinate-nucleotide pyrophosphorylase (carboxylating)